MAETILLIDDERDVLEMLTLLLEGEGFDVYTAGDGQEGVEQFRELRPNLVITDVKMPKKDGLALLREIREMNSGADIIILTGHSDEFSAMECLRLGAYDYLSKPLEDIEILVAAVNRALSKRRLKLENIKLKQLLKDVAIRDDLTGVYNHRYLHHRLDEELKRSERYGLALSALSVDIEDFDGVNTTHNRQIGDTVLKRFAENLLQISRYVDLCCRIIGDRFFLILPETPIEGAEKMAMRILDRVHGKVVTAEGQRVLINIRIGGVSLSGRSVQSTELICHTDEALAKAKDGAEHPVFIMEI